MKKAPARAGCLYPSKVIIYLYPKKTKQMPYQDADKIRHNLKKGIGGGDYTRV
jgi:hypothetical protein